jgi:hypothetical protein
MQSDLKILFSDSEKKKLSFFSSRGASPSADPEMEPRSCESYSPTISPHKKMEQFRERYRLQVRVPAEATPKNNNNHVQFLKKVRRDEDMAKDWTFTDLAGRSDTPSDSNSISGSHKLRQIRPVKAVDRSSKILNERQITVKNPEIDNNHFQSRADSSYENKKLPIKESKEWFPTAKPSSKFNPSVQLPQLKPMRQASEQPKKLQASTSSSTKDSISFQVMNKHKNENLIGPTKQNSFSNPKRSLEPISLSKDARPERSSTISWSSIIKSSDFNGLAQNPARSPSNELKKPSLFIQYQSKRNDAIAKSTISKGYILKFPNRKNFI